jgi:ribosomal protein L40E
MKCKTQEVKMVICPQCNIEHSTGEEFCRKCGKFLLMIEDPDSEDEIMEKLICPKCQEIYTKGHYCKKCGSLLMHETPSQQTNIQPFEKKSIKKLSKKWLILLGEKKELETCMSKLETQRNRVSGDVINTLSICYQDRLKSLSPRHQEIEKELESIKKRTLEEIGVLEKELKPIQKRLEEFQFLNKLGAVINDDFIKEKKGMRKEIKSRERSLKKHRQILSLLPSKMGGSMVSPKFSGNLLQPFSLSIVIGIVILLSIGGYLFWQGHSPFRRPISKETTASITTPPPPLGLFTVIEDNETEKIKSLFENIRQANLQKDIDLFISCFSHDFKGMEGKRKDTLKMWENYDYLNLSFNLKDQAITDDTANIRLEWLVKTSKRVSGQRHDGKTLLDVILKREDDLWKIIEIKPVS